MMARIALLALALGLFCGCNKPTEEECQKAIDNVRRITDTLHSSGGPDSKAAVRECRAWWSRDQVRCAMAAQDDEALEKCEKMGTK